MNIDERWILRNEYSRIKKWILMNNKEWILKNNNECLLNNNKEGNEQKEFSKSITQNF